MREPSSDPPPRYWIERAPHGYRVVGPALLIWEPTLGEAQERRDEIEGGVARWRAAAPRPLACEAPLRRPVYGPIASRRLGRSLGVDLSPPGRRACSFDCVYCSWSRLPAAAAGSGWPEPRAVAAALAEALRCERELDSITISGHGEPTLHPRFAETVDAVLAVVEQSGCSVPVRILTNGTEAAREPVRRALDRLDERIVKLDADTHRVGRPRALRAVALRPLALAALRDVTVQACFIGGAATNALPASVAAWSDAVAAAAPRAVQIYSIDRQPAACDVLPLGARQLEEIACALRARTGIEARVFG
ncbi:MAG: hypothetical protein DCC71_25805 [Proteobacteria bacterium]|nr:MAG: hypothetical protein DCC71_25805 [Pseudomonadota bacterium]